MRSGRPSAVGNASTQAGEASTYFYRRFGINRFNRKNMKNSLIVICLLISSAAYSQTYMDKIAAESCNCITKVPESNDYEQYSQELGLCMIVASEPYKKQLKKDHGINFDHIDRDAEKLGKIIGFRMASVCPEAVMAVAKKASSSGEKTTTKLCEGTLTKFENESFVVLHVKDQDSRTNKFYWLTFVDSDVELIDRYEAMVGSPVRITYRTEEMFDPKIKEYRQYSIIEKLEASSN